MFQSRKAESSRERYEGPHPLSVESTDAAGNFTQSEQLLVEIDTTAPGAPTAALAAYSDTGVVGDGITSIQQPAFVGVAEANAHVRVYANGVLVGEGHGEFGRERRHRRRRSGHCGR